MCQQEASQSFKIGYLVVLKEKNILIPEIILKKSENNPKSYIVKNKMIRTKKKFISSKKVNSPKVQ